MAPSRMTNTLPPAGHRTEAEHGSVAVQGVLPLDVKFDERTVDQQIAAVYAALRAGVDVYDVKQGSFADDMGKPKGDVSQRLNHAVVRGELQRAHVDYIGWLALKPAARVAFLQSLAAAWGYKVIPAVVSDTDRARILRSVVNDKVKRQLERENGWPVGSLDE